MPGASALVLCPVPNNLVTITGDMALEFGSEADATLRRLEDGGGAQWRVGTVDRAAVGPGRGPDLVASIEAHTNIAAELDIRLLTRRSTGGPGNSSTGPGFLAWTVRAESGRLCRFPHIQCLVKGPWRVRYRAPRSLPGPRRLCCAAAPPPRPAGLVRPTASSTVSHRRLEAELSDSINPRGR